MIINRQLASFYKNKLVTVTGGAGFIGSHLVEQLVLYGAHVTVIDNLLTGSVNNLIHVLSNIRFIKESISTYASCLKATEKSNIIFHLAACIAANNSDQESHRYQDTNVKGTFNLLEAALYNNVKTFIFSSSAAIYGNATQPCHESTTGQLTTFYGLSKLLGEQYCLYYAQKYHLNTVILRYFNVFGNRQSPYAGVYAHFKEKMSLNQPITIFGNGLQKRDFVPVEKIVQANLMAALKAPMLSKEIINIATGHSMTLLELIGELNKQFPNYTGSLIFKPEREGDIISSIAHCEKYKSLF